MRILEIMTPSLLRVSVIDLNLSRGKLVCVTDIPMGLPESLHIIYFKNSDQCRESESSIL
jgi:hypothetical protein